MLDRLAGNQRAKDLLRRLLESRRVPGSLLFAGEEGIGKKLFALEVAKALNCRTPNGVEGCDTCAICRRMVKFNYPETSGTDDLKKIFWTDHPDVGMVEPPKRVLVVDQMREIEREANYRPFEGLRRVFLIDEADKLNESSSNALLKTLEEPPETSHLILITSRPAMLLPTIRSRCQTIRFAPLSTEEIATHLIKNKLASASEARLRARFAAGSIGRALSGDPDLYKEQRQAMLSVLNALALTGDRVQLLRAAEGLNDARVKDEYEARLDILETLIRDTLMLTVGGGEEGLTNSDLLPQLTQVAQKITSARAVAWIEQIEELREQLESNVNRKVATDALFLSMAGA
ncbi:MAG TPA: DNA polymerase III subunit delta' C-terminal domain-containing protein [Pyrinomonadaceae bacterium]|nr:DNA polymerase III subunit delta' C-terminal domain-containing protein [Pyrinomonadaceae bacterium]